MRYFLKQNWKEKKQELFESESVELGIILIGSAISEIAIMRTSESISTSIVAIPKIALKPVISKNKGGKRFNALLQNNKSSPNNKYGCIQNKKEDYDSYYSQMSAPRLLKSKSTNLSKGNYKKDFFDKEISELHNALKQSTTPKPSIFSV